MKNISIYDLAFDYMEKFPVSDDKATKKEVIIEMAYLLAEGWTDKEIATHLDKFRASNPGKVPDLKLIFKDKERKETNLLMPLKFYYHNELRVLPPPPVVDVDYNTGEFKKVVSDYYLEMKASFTINDLYEYYLTKDGLYEKATMNPNRVLGSLSWLVNKFPLDQVLFMIDIAYDIITTNDKPPLSTPMEIQDYFQKSADALNQKVTESKIAGDGKIVPKKRVLSSRNGILGK